MSIDNYFVKRRKADSDRCSYDKFEYISGDEIIFEYRLKNAGPFEVCEDEDGFSITIFKSGFMLYREYICEDIEVAFRKFMLPESVVMNIYNKIIEAGIYDIPEMLNNGSFDGSFNNFVFYGNKKIVALNIDAVSEYRNQLNRCTLNDENGNVDLEDDFDMYSSDKDFEGVDKMDNSSFREGLDWKMVQAMESDKYCVSQDFGNDSKNEFKVDSDGEFDDDLLDMDIEKVIEYEERLIDLFDEISEELRTEGYKLTLHSFEKLDN